MNKLRNIVVVAGMAICSLAAADGAYASETVGEALRNSNLLVNWRMRYESVEQAGFAQDADALTNRIRLGVQTGSWGNTSLLAEAVAAEAASGDYNSTINGKTQFPVVADPGDIFAVNRFAIVNESLDNAKFTIGRQRIVLDDARFVGNVGWRQHEQTFDGLRVVFGGGESLQADLSVISQVNRIFGPDSAIGKFDGDIFLANISKPLSFGTLTGFLYGVDLDQAAALSTNTIGLRLTGSRAFENLTGIYTASLAQQSDTGSNTADLSEMYFKLEGGLRFGAVTVALGLEQLGSDGVNRVTMPLATLHAFQGWADKFLGTPATGIDDSYARIAWQLGSAGPFNSVNLGAFYHVFDADYGSAHYGDELDISLNARTDHVSVTLKYASYDADELLTDTDKIWLSMDYTF